jgi:hypothetical protein
MRKILFYFLSVQVDISAHVGWKDGGGDSLVLVVRAAVSTSYTEAMANAGRSTGTKYIYT